MKKIILSAVMGMFASLGMAVECGSLSVPEIAKWDATHYIAVSYKDLTVAVSNTVQTLTNVLRVAAGESLELSAFVLDQAWVSASHTNAYTNSIALTVTDAGGTNSIMGSTEISEEGTEVWLKLPYVNSTLTYLTTGAATTTATVVTSPAGNKYYSAANHVDLTFTPSAGEILGTCTSGGFRLFFRKHKSKD
jgi:hypothetical protein